jgi:hypothetical protein
MFTVAHALGFSVFTSHILATDFITVSLSLQITYEVSFPFPFLPLFCNCQFNSIQFLFSQAHIPAGWRPETRLFTSDSTVPYSVAEQSRAEQSSSLLPAISQHGHSWHRAPLGPIVIYLFSVKTFFSSFVVPPLIKSEGLGFFIIGVPLLHLIPPRVTLK